MAEDNEERLRRRRAANRASYLRNREKRLEKNRQWRENNRDRMKALNARYYQENLEKARADRARYRAENPEKTRAAIKAWYDRNKRAVAAKLRLKTTGCTPEEYDRLLEIQKGVCAICLNPPGKHPLAADHCHVNNFIRGLLCHRCNTVLGLMRDNPLTLRQAAQYLYNSNLRLT